MYPYNPILEYRTDFGRSFQPWRGFGQNGPKMCVPPPPKKNEMVPFTPIRTEQFCTCMIIIMSIGTIIQIAMNAIEIDKFRRQLL